MVTNKNHTLPLTRREVLRGATAVAALSPFRAALAAAEVFRPPAFAYVAASPSGQTGKQGCIHVFSIVNGKWSSIQQMPSRAPASLVLSHTQRALYVANDVAEDAGLPRGTVEAFAIAPDGKLALLGSRPMALSGTHPRAMALSPDGSLLAVAAYEGGLYSVFPIGASGHLCAARQHYKQTGSGPNRQKQSSAHPHTLLFDQDSGRLLTSDLGADRLHSFSLDRGTLRQEVARDTGAGSGPGVFVLHRDSGTLIVAHEIEGALVSYRYDHARGIVGQEMQRVPVNQPRDKGHSRPGFALHASGRMLYSAWGSDVTAWQVDVTSGRLSRPQALSLGAVTPSQLVAAPDGTSLLIVDRNFLYRVNTDSDDGWLKAAEKVISLEDARCMALKNL